MSAIVAMRPRLTDVVSTLRGFAITTFTVPLHALEALLPEALTAERFTLDDGRVVGMVSAVTFTNHDFRVGFAPFIRLTAPQTNFRAYVRRGDEQAVFFFGTTLGSPFVALPRYVWRLPWAFGRHDNMLRVERGSVAEYRYASHGEHGEERVVARGTSVPMGRLDGFPDEATTTRLLTHPLIGYLRRRDGAYVTYGVDHGTLAMERADATEARFALFERLGLVTPGQAPHSVLLLPATVFVVRLPPKRVPFTPRVSR